MASGRYTCIPIRCYRSSTLLRWYMLTFTSPQKELKDVPLEHVFEPWKMSFKVQESSNCIIGQHYPMPVQTSYSSNMSSSIPVQTAYGNNMPRPPGHFRFPFSLYFRFFFFSFPFSLFPFPFPLSFPLSHTSENKHERLNH
jgi:hypothetical protein